MDGSAEAQAAKALNLVSDGMSAFAGSSELWASALGKLSLEDRKIIEAAGEIKLKVTIDSVYREAKEAQESLESDRTTVNFRGQDYELYSIWTKIVEGIQAFQSFVTSAIKLDVSGHAALPWAVIQVIIKPLIAEKEQFETVSAGMVTIAEVIKYYAEFERLYLHEELEIVRLLKESVQGVYEHILRFLCLAKAYFVDKKSRNPLKKLWGIASKTKEILQSPLNDIESGNAMVDTWANLVRRETEVNILDELTKIQTDLGSHERWKLLRWISKDSALEDHAKYGRDRLQDSGMWLLNHPGFQAWRYSPSSSLMWLRGSVGTGKSTLMSLVIDSFLERLSATKSTPILYFYCKEGQNPEDVLRNLVRQLIILNPDTSPSLTNDSIDRSPLGATECLDLITAFVKKSDCVTIAIDSLDRCRPQKQATSRYTYVKLLEDLISLLGKSHRPMKILVSSGMEDAKIDAAFRGLSPSQKHCISVDKQPLQDIKRFISSEVMGWSEAQFLPSEDDKSKVVKVKQAIIERVTRKAGRMFLWAAHVLIWFRDNPNLGTETAIRRELKLDLLPEHLEELYDRSYNIVAGPKATGDAQSAARAMMLLFCAKNPLLSAGFIDAVRGKNPADEERNHAKAVRDLVASCQGFVVYDKELDVFRFRHPSVEQYLRKQEGYEAKAHLAMAEVCLASILHDAEMEADEEGDEEGDEEREEEGEEEESDHDDEEENGDDSGEERRGRPRSRGPASTSRSTKSSGSAGLSGASSKSPYADIQTLSRNKSADADSSDHSSSVALRSSSVPILSKKARKRSPSSSSASSHHSSRSRLSSRSSSRPASAGGVWDGPGGALPRARLPSFGTEDSGSRRPYASRWSHAQQGRANLNTVIQDFQGYATLYWAAHYSACGDIGEAGEEVRERMQDLLMVDGNFHFWIRSVQRLLSQQPLGFYNEEVETELMECIEHPPTPFQVACVYGFTDIVQEFCEETPALTASKNMYDTTGLHLACRFGRVETVKFLASLESADQDFVAEDANNKSALHHAVETAKDPAVVQLLLKTTTKKYQLESAVLEAAMSNPWCAEGLVKHLLGGRGGTYRKVPKESRTTSLALAAMTYPSTNLDLFKAVSDSSSLDTDFLVAAAQSRHGRGRQEWPKRKRIWQYLLSRVVKTIHSGKDNMTRLVLKAAAEGGDVDLLGYIIQQEKPLFLHEVIFNAAAGNEYRPCHLVKTLLGAKIPGIIRGEALQMVMINPAADSELISLLCKPTPPVEMVVGDVQGVIHGAAGNCKLGAEMLSMLPEMNPINYHIPYETVRLAVANGNLAVLKLILPARSPEKQESENAKNPTSFEDAENEVKALQQMVADAPGEVILSDLRDKKPSLAPRLVSEAPEDDWDRRIAECLKVILQNDGVKADWITEEVLVDAAEIRGPWAMKVLLDWVDNIPEEIKAVRDRKRVKIRFQERRKPRRLLMAAAGNKLYGHKLLPFLEQYFGENRLPLDEAALLDEAASQGSLSTVLFLLGKEPLESYSREFLLAAASNSDLGVVEFLFRRINGEAIGAAELEAAAANSDETLEYLLGRLPVQAREPSSPSRQLPRLELAKLIAQNCRRTRTLQEAADRSLEEHPTTALDIQELITCAARNLHTIDMASHILKKFRKLHRAKISSDMLEAAASNRYLASEMLRVLLNECDDSDVEALITTEVLCSAARNGLEAPDALHVLLYELKPETFGDTIRSRVVLAARLNDVAGKETLRVITEFMSRKGALDE